METAIDEPPSYLLLGFIDNPIIYFSLSGGILILLLGMSALISGSEVAFFSLSANDLQQCREEKRSNDKSVLRLMKKPKLLLATILILNNFVNVAIVTISTFVTWQIAGTKSPEGVTMIVLTGTVTFLIVFFGEVIPKVYATQSNLLFARRMANFLRLSEAVFKPLSWFLLSISDVVDKKIQKKGYHISVDELNKALEITTTEETTEEEKGILKGIVNFGTLTVKQIMKSRMDITAFDTEMDFHELMDKVNKSGFSRIPVYEETIDNIKGILYIKDILPFLEEDEYFKWQSLLRQSFFVPETKKIDSLLKDFQKKRVHMAIVVDEYGGTSGLITMEDIIEEIVGEINDEFDNDGVPYNQMDQNTYVFEGKTSLNDFCKVIGEDVSLFDEVKGESESLGGLILEINTKMPRSGETVVFDKFTFTAVAVDQRKIKRVRVFIGTHT